MIMRKTTDYLYRHAARVVVEAITPLKLGSGEKSILTDSLIATDANGLPYIPGTSIAGVVRHTLDVDDSDKFFGYQHGEDGHGSEIMFSEARMIGTDGKVVDGLDPCIDLNDPFYNIYKVLPIRQHVRIGHKGTHEEGGKFDEQVVPKGTRFCFVIEAMSDGSKDASARFASVLDSITSKSLRLGGGTRKGFGEMMVVSVETRNYDLGKSDDMEAYLSKSSSLNYVIGKPLDIESVSPDGWIRYKLNLKPEDFIMFGSGLGDDEVDMTPVKETSVKWDNGLPVVTYGNILIPASSLKGALAHRTAFHYNKNVGNFAYSPELVEEFSAANKAVQSLFGTAGDDIKRGNVLFSDIIESASGSEDKILNHVVIDRFTGGAIDGFLFSEKATYAKGKCFETIILVDASVAEDYVNAFEKAIMDLCRGVLPLGGGVNRGHGFFSGVIYKNDVKLSLE